MYVHESIAIFLIAFFIGSIPVGVLLAKAFGLPDPRSIGSGNIGATNMLRTGNKKVALLTLLLDALKGVAGVLVAHLYYSYAHAPGALFDCFNPAWQATLRHAVVIPYWAAMFAVAGHCYSPWLNGKGGKGVATALGVIIGLDIITGNFGQMLLPLAISWGGIFWFRRYVSLASVATAAFFPIVAFVCHQVVLPPALIALIIIWRHRENIKRLRAGTEPKMGGKKDA